MRRAILFFVFLVSGASILSAQQLLTPSFTFSKKKTSYVTLMDGTEISGNIKDIDRKKGLIKFVNIKDGSGKKHKLQAEEIKFMYLMPSGWDKMSKIYEFAGDAQRWNDEKLDQDVLNQGYVYFELADVKIKKKTRKLLMQLLNPNFSKEVKVYHDPFAKETASVGVAGVKVAGGIAKSYYVAKGNSASFRLKKKDYKTEFMPFWKGCPEVGAKYTDIKWSEFVDHILAYTECKS